MIKLPNQTVKKEWIDYNGHMNVTYYTLAFDTGLAQFLAVQFGIDHHYVKEHQIGPFALQSNYCYLSELREGEQFYVAIRILDYDYKRIHLFLQIHRSQDSQLSATCEMLSLNVNHNSRKSTPYPEDILEKIQSVFNSTKFEPIPTQVNQPIGIRR